MKQEVNALVTNIERTRYALIEANQHQSFHNDPTINEAFYSASTDDMRKVIAYTLSHFPASSIPTTFKDPATGALMTQPTLHLCNDELHTLDESSFVVDDSSNTRFCPLTYAPVTRSTIDYDLQEKIYQYALVMVGINPLTSSSSASSSTDPVADQRSYDFGYPSVFLPSAPYAPSISFIGTNTELFILNRLCQSLEETISLLILTNANHASSSYVCTECLAAPESQTEGVQRQIALIGELLDTLPSSAQQALFYKMFERHQNDPALSQRVNRSLFSSPFDQGNLLFFDNLHVAASVLAEAVLDTLNESQSPVLGIFKNEDSFSTLIHDGELNGKLHDLSQLAGLIRSVVTN